MPAMIDVLKIGERGVAKVATKDGTVKLCLPGVVEVEDVVTRLWLRKGASKS